MSQSSHCFPFSTLRRKALRALAEDGSLRLTISGNSMFPAFREGQLVEIGAGGNRLWPGDVIAFWDGHDQLVLHRIIGFRPVSFFPFRLQLLTQGDNSPDRDAPLARQRVLGRVEPISWLDRLSYLSRAPRWIMDVASRRLRARFFGASIARRASS